jgi:hypothetical protein
MALRKLFHDRIGFAVTLTGRWFDSDHIWSYKMTWMVYNSPYMGVCPVDRVHSKPNMS